MKASLKTYNGKPYWTVTEGLIRKLPRTVDEMVKNVADVIVKRAQKTYRYAYYDGTNDVTVYSTKLPADKDHIVYKITAHSPTGSVAFIEFGAGLGANLTTVPHAWIGKTDPAIGGITSYGKHNGSLDYWVYKGGIPTRCTDNWRIPYDKNGNPRFGYNWTMGNKPTRAMYNAVQYTKKNIGVILAGGKK